jgi:excisionase family DNA binding protein
MRERSYTLNEVADILAISMSQAYAIVRSGELKAFQVGGKLVWRIEPADLDAYIDEMKRATAQRLSSEPKHLPTA